MSRFLTSQFSRALLCLFVLSGLSACGITNPATEATPDSTNHLAEGPLAGAVTDTTANIWLRTAAPANVQIRYSRDATLADSVVSAAVASDASTDFTTNVPITHLLSQQDYYYNVLIDDKPQLAQPFPHFKTFAPANTNAAFQFAILTDFRTISKITQPVSTFRHAAAEHPDFVILGGDLDHRNPKTEADKRQMFRDLYTAANGMEDFVNLVLHNFSLAHQWDDHDIGENNADKTYPDKALALKVLREYFPLYPVTQYGDWQKFSYGQADFFMLDSRSQRDPAHLSDSPSKSMLDGDHLGAAGQRDWLWNGLKNSQATWKFILSPVTFNPTTKTNDAWGAYPDERAALLQFINDNHITGVVVLSGDLHMGAIDDGSNSGLPEMVAPSANDGFIDRCLTDPPGIIGIWSIGHYGDKTHAPCNGYAVVSVLTNPDRVRLDVKDDNGKTQLTYTIARTW